MKKIFCFLCLGFLFSFSQAATYINTVGSDDGVAISGFDPVSFFTDKKSVAGSPEFEHVHEGAKWLFSNENNLKLFKENPDKYMPE
jgi:YHS domain-containing protein